MKPLLALVLTGFLPMAALAAEATQPAPTPSPLVQPAGDADLAQFHWLARPVVVFADSPDDPQFRQQIELLEAGKAELLTRDVIVLTDTDPAARNLIRAKLRPRGFQMVLIDKDGQVKLRKPFPWSVREISRSIDKSPIRLQEERDRRTSP